MGKASKQTNSVKTTAAPSKKVENSKYDAIPDVKKELIADHLPPIALVFAILACSGFLFIFAFRDAFATGRPIGGEMEAAFLHFSKSTMFYDNSNGWKSQQGGLSTIQSITTDANNMGGLFVRKVGGAASMAVQFQKLMPMLVHPWDARWKRGHFRPFLFTAVISNIVLSLFYAMYLPDLAAAGADGLANTFMAVLCIESMVILSYLYSSRKVTGGPAVAMTDGKNPSSLPSRIVCRTVLVCTGAVSLIAGRDLFFPGKIISFVPRDDIYLEWTNAFFHSPPEGTMESEENGMMTELFVGDKFLSQFMALNLLLLSLFKLVSGFAIRYGSDGSGLVKARMMWRTLFFGNFMVVIMIRLFASAAVSASLDLRWHIMTLGYETLIFGAYSFL